MRNTNDISVTVWWTPDCGAMHIEENPVVIGPVCPDGLTGFANDTETP